MKQAKPDDTLPAVEREPFLIRLQRSRALLYLHGFISESENEKVKQRLNKWVSKFPVLTR